MKDDRKMKRKKQNGQCQQSFQHTILLSHRFESHTYIQVKHLHTSHTSMYKLHIYMLSDIYIQHICIQSDIYTQVTHQLTLRHVHTRHTSVYKTHIYIQVTNLHINQTSGKYTDMQVCWCTADSVVCYCRTKKEVEEEGFPRFPRCGLHHSCGGAVQRTGGGLHHQSGGEVPHHSTDGVLHHRSGGEVHSRSGRGWSPEACQCRGEEAQEAEKAGEDDDGWTPVPGRGGRGAVHDAEEKEEVQEYGVPRCGLHHSCGGAIHRKGGGLHHQSGGEVPHHSTDGVLHHRGGGEVHSRSGRGWSPETSQSTGEEAEEGEEAGEDDDGWTPVPGGGGRGTVQEGEEKEEEVQEDAFSRCGLHHSCGGALHRNGGGLHHQSGGEVLYHSSDGVLHLRGGGEVHSRSGRAPGEDGKGGGYEGEGKQEEDDGCMRR